MSGIAILVEVGGMAAVGLVRLLETHLPVLNAWLPRLLALLLFLVLLAAFRLFRVYSRFTGRSSSVPWNMKCFSHPRVRDP